ncbi:MAG: hypothetical protein AAGA70_01430 [Pseudomonadota bacterium]
MAPQGEGAASLHTLARGVLVVEFVWWVGGGAYFAASYSRLFGSGTALEASVSLLGTGLIWLAAGIALRLFQNRSWISFLSPSQTAFADFVGALTWSGGVMLGLALLFVQPFADRAV